MFKFDVLPHQLMRILVLCYEYPPIGGGGGRVAKNVTEQLAARGHEVRVQTAGMSHLPPHERIEGVEVFRTQSLRQREDTCAVHEMGLYVLTSFWPTLRHIRRWKPDVMHVHFAMPTGLLAWAAHLLTRTPYVLTAHLGDVPGGVPDQTDRLFRIVGPIARRVWRAAAAATAVSSFVQRLATTAYGKPVTTIVNGIELSGAAAPSSAVPQERRLVFVGRFNPQKNPVLIIDALQQLSHLPWQLTMIGDGPLRTAVEERIAAAGLSSRVQLTRWLAGPEVERILGASDILLMPSLSEGMPVAAVEALKHGLAIVASDIPGVADVVEDGVNGTLSPVGDTDGFAQQLRRFLEDAELLQKMKAASWDKVRRFDLQAVTSEYERVLKAAAQ